MQQKNILLLCGGGHSEHDISLISASYLKDQLSADQDLNVFFVEITKEGKWREEKKGNCELNLSGELCFSSSEKETLHYAIPCLHGPPGESGDIQSYFELIGLPYLGAGPEASMSCFNKVTTKLWFESAKIPNTPFVYLHQLNEEALKKALEAFENWGQVYIKSSSQGSSIGCYFIKEKEELREKLEMAFKLSPYVLLERPIKGRELEMAAYEWEGKLVVTAPAEIIPPSTAFYSFEEKYSQKSQTETHVKAKNLNQDLIDQMREIAERAFKLLKVKDLSRIDFFLGEDNKIYLNEVNTFPGMTPISLFPKMMEENGHCFKKFLEEKIKESLRKRKTHEA